MSDKALIKKDMITWVRNRANLSDEVLAKKINVKADKLIEWEQGVDLPTIKQAMKLAHACYVPFAYLFLNTPPQDELAIPDLRTVGAKKINKPSPELKDMIKLAELKQAWYKDYLLSQMVGIRSYVGKFTIKSKIQDVVQSIREELQVPVPEKGTYEEYFSSLIKGAENAGIMVIRTGYAGSSTRRTLDVNEFRGFALSDDVAPLIFINSSDAPSARLFTLIHELAHIWIGASGVSDVDVSHEAEESFCNSVAGEFLVPRKILVDLWCKEDNTIANASRVAKRLHVSKFVVVRKAYDCHLISNKEYHDFYKLELAQFKDKKAGQGDYYRNQNAKNSSLLSKAVIQEALSGRMLFRDASRLLGIKPSLIRTFAGKIA